MKEELYSQKIENNKVPMNRKFIYYISYLLFFVLSNNGHAEDSAEDTARLKRELEETRAELSSIKREVSNIKSDFSSFKERVLRGEIKSSGSSQSSPDRPVISGDSSEDSIKSVKKYDLKSKGFSKISDLEDNQGKRYAITIGINKYQDTGISELSKARNDAKIVGKILKNEGQFDQVFVMTDDVDPRNDKENLYPTKLNIEEKIDSILQFSSPDDLIVFFFSGHGISDPQENGYLVTIDTVTGKQFNTSLQINSVVAKLRTKGIRKSLLVLDACRDVLYTTKSSARNSIIEKDFADSDLAATFYSTKAGYYSYEDDETEYGVFTKYLVMGMEGQADKNADGVIAFSELESYVHKGVKDWSTRKNKQQRPYTRVHGERAGDIAITFSNGKSDSITEKKIPPAVTRSDVIFRSVFAPGWGQFYAGSKIKGTIYSVTALGLAGYAGYRSQVMANAQSDYNSTIVLPGTSLFYPTYFQLKNAHSKLEDAQAGLTTALGVLTAFWIWNIIDSGAFTDLPKQDFFSLDIKVKPVNEQMIYARQTEQYGGISYTWRF